MAKLEDEATARDSANKLTLGLQIPPRKVFGPSKPTPNTFSEGTTGALGPGICGSGNSVGMTP